MNKKTANILHYSLCWLLIHNSIFYKKNVYFNIFVRCSFITGQGRFITGNGETTRRNFIEIIWRY